MDYDPSKRLGCKGFDEVKNHEFFKGVDWDNIKEMEPPFKPDIEDELDTVLFSENKKFNLKELEEIQNDMDNYNSNLDHFDSTVTNTLADINRKAAVKAMIKAKQLSKYNSEA